MAAIWIVSEESALPATLAHHVEALGDVFVGVPERAAFKNAPPPDLLILCGVVEDSTRHEALERLLAFVRQIPQSRRASAPVLYLGPDENAGQVARLERVFDDRRAAFLDFPLDPDDLETRARDLLETSSMPASLRERARTLWVTHEVERLYAGIDLPQLRQAVDPRNAHRPVLLLGEAGTRRGLLARYVHNLAEPERDLFVSLSLSSLLPGELERSIMTRTAGRRATVCIEAIDRAAPALQDELADLLGASGALALEPLRWIASATRINRVSRPIRELTWLRVELPALRARADKSALIEASFRAAAERQGRELELEAEALALLAEYRWPGNLRELDHVAETSAAISSGDRVRASDLCISRIRQPAPPEIPSPLAPKPPEPPETSDEDLMLATFEENSAPPGESPLDDSPFELDDAGLVDLDDLVVEAEPVVGDVIEPPPRIAEPLVPPKGLPTRALVVPLAQAIRAPLRAIRTYAGLVEQRPDDERVRRELRSLVDQDLGGLEDTLQRVERFARLGPPVTRPFDLAAVLGAELDARHEKSRAKSLVVLRELDAQAPPLVADEGQLRMAIGALLDLALRLVPQGGDLYLGSAWRPKGTARDAGHRILLRFHSPEDVLTESTGDPDAELLEVVIARDLFERVGGSFAIDASGAQDNVILVELPG